MVEDLAVELFLRHEGRRLDSVQWLRDTVAAARLHESAIARAHLCDWFNADLLTRLKPRGAVVLIATPYHCCCACRQAQMAATLARGVERWAHKLSPAAQKARDRILRRQAERDARMQDWQDVWQRNRHNSPG